MRLPYSWLKELTGLEWSVSEMANRLTLCGTACEDIEPTARFLKHVVVGEVIDLQPVEGADKIKKAVVNVGKEKLDVICGAPNVAIGQKVPVATIGAKLAGGMEIKKARIRGVESHGMICSESELGISQDHTGIMVLNGCSRLGAPLVEVLDYDDFVMTFELTPNRGDSTSAIGVARDLAALASVKVKRPKFGIKESIKKAAQFIKVRIDDVDACPRYAARVIEGVKIDESPWWIKKKLLMSGIRPINNVVDITNLVMLESGHPLHAFDLDRFGSSEVVVRRASNSELFATLDGKEHKLSEDVLLITNGKEGVAAGGVMGGLNSEVEAETSRILLEAAYFNPSVIRRGRKYLNMTSESQTRFEKGTDPNGIEYGINRAAFLFQEICGGEVLRGMVDCYPKKITPRKVSFRPERCNAVLGMNITAARMKKIFGNLGFQVSATKKIQVTVPTFRSDVEREIDLIEEIARIEGYDKIPDEVENIGPLFTKVHYIEHFSKDVRAIMTGLGFDEIIGHGFTDSKQAELVNPGLPQLHLENPVSAELDVMCNSLIPFALNVTEHNISHRTLDLRMFQLGRAYFPPSSKGEWIEEDRLLILVSGQTKAGWREKPRDLDFYDITGSLFRLGSHFHWPELEFREASTACFDESISFEVLGNQTKIGQIGLVSERIADKFGIKQQVYLTELIVPSLLELTKPEKEFYPLPVYPAAPRDLAILVDESVKAADIVATVKEAAGSLAESVSIFDLYQGKQIEKGKKSLAVSISYRSAEGSLSTEQVEQQQRLVVDNLKKKLNAEIRDK